MAEATEQLKECSISMLNHEGNKIYRIDGGHENGVGGSGVITYYYWDDGSATNPNYDRMANKYPNHRSGGSGITNPKGIQTSKAKKWLKDVRGLEWSGKYVIFNEWNGKFEGGVQHHIELTHPDGFKLGVGAILGFSVVGAALSLLGNDNPQEI